HEQRSGLPFEDARLLVAAPDFGRAAPFDHQEKLVVDVLFGIGRIAAGHFQDVHAFDAFEAVEVQKRAASVASAPGAKADVAGVANADAAQDRHAFLFHPPLVRAVGALVYVVTGGFVAAGFDPGAELVLLRHAEFKGSASQVRNTRVAR